MKKSSLLFIITVVMLSCGSTYKAKKIVLSDFQDSINYAVGFHNGRIIQSQLFTTDSGAPVINAFIDALSEGYNSKQEALQCTSIGANIGTSLKKNEKTGLADNANWILNEDIFFKGFMNGIIQDTTVLTFKQAQSYFERISSTDNQNESAPENKTVKKAKCPTKKEFQPVTLTSKQDSINYVFGYLNGYQIYMYALANDSNSKEFNALVKNINENLTSTSKYTEQIAMGKQIGSTIKSQEEKGLLGIEEWETRFELIKQGFINGLYSFTEVLEAEDAQNFISQNIDKFKFGKQKEDNQVWLAQNAQKKGVKETQTGLQYEVIKMGTGKKPTFEDKVKVHYHGTLINGTVFDSSVDRGEPAEFPLNSVIAGWTEGLQLMPVGSKFKFYIKPELGYGSSDMGTIPPYSILIFEVELLGIINK